MIFHQFCLVLYSIYYIVLYGQSIVFSSLDGVEFLVPCSYDAKFIHWWCVCERFQMPLISVYDFTPYVCIIHATDKYILYLSKHCCVRAAFYKQSLTLTFLLHFFSNWTLVLTSFLVMYTVLLIVCWVTFYLDLTSKCNGHIIIG